MTAAYVAVLGTGVRVGDGGGGAVKAKVSELGPMEACRHRAWRTSVMWPVSDGRAVVGAESRMSINVARAESRRDSRWE
jgi:hypothetical protein